VSIIAEIMVDLIVAVLIVEILFTIWDNWQ